MKTILKLVHIWPYYGPIIIIILLLYYYYYYYYYYYGKYAKSVNKARQKKQSVFTLTPEKN